MRLSQVAKILNKGLSSVASTLSAKGFKVEINPNTKINTEQLEVLAKEFKASDLLTGARKSADAPAPAEAHREAPARRDDDYLPRYSRDEQGRPNTVEGGKTAPAGAPAGRTPEPAKPTAQPAQREAAPASGLPGLTVVGKIDLNPPKPAPPVQAVRTPAPAPVPAKAPEAPKPPVVAAPEAKAPAPVSVPVQAAATCGSPTTGTGNSGSKAC